MKSLFTRYIILLLVFSLFSCVENSKPNYQYMPNMYETVSYEPYGAYEVFENEQEALLPAEGSVPRGWSPYEYEDSNEGYEAAKAELKNPIPYTRESLAAGKALYTIYCAVCHGDTGDGQGILAQREKFLGIPSYEARELTEGSVYHVMYYGMNAMGSYASQTTIKERWLIDQYVMKLRNDLVGGPEMPLEDELPPGTEEQETNQEQEAVINPAINAEGEVIPEDQEQQNDSQENQN